MAIYHCQLQGISRSAGRSMLACAAYRSGEKLVDERTGEIYDYTRKGGVIESEVILPGGKTCEREQLWNAVEMAEKRKDAKVGREIVVALPAEMTDKERTDLVKGYAEDLSNRTGWAVDLSIHEPGRGGDSRNHHAHLLCSTRQVSLDDDKGLVIGAKTREWDVIQTSKPLVTQERQYWEQAVNKAMERCGYEQRIDCRSYAEQGNDLTPTIHMGVHATAMERRGIQTEIGDQNREIREHNRDIIEMEQFKTEKEQAIAWKEELGRLREMPFKELEHAYYYKYPSPSKEKLYQGDKQVKLYTEAVVDSERSLSNCEKELGDTQWRIKNAQGEENRYREAHPVQAWFHDRGIVTAETLKDCSMKQDRLADSLEKLRDKLDVCQDEHSKARYELEKARGFALLGVEKTYAKEDSRHKDVREIYQERQQQERERQRELGQYRGMER